MLQIAHETEFPFWSQPTFSYPGRCRWQIALCQPQPQLAIFHQAGGPGVDGRHLEALPSGWVLVVRNEDTPGVIGHLGTVLGNAGINIARMQLGLDYGKHEAVGLIQVDERIPESVLEKFAALPNIIWVKQIEL